MITDTNQVPTRAVYDTYGRISKVIRPGDSESAPTLYFTYNNYSSATSPFYTRAEQLISGTTKYIVQKYYDGLGQMLQSRTVGATLSSGTKDVLVDYWYDAYGRVTSQSTPYEVAPASGFERNGAYTTQTSYDVLGRPAERHCPGWQLFGTLHLPGPGDAGQGRPRLHHPQPGGYLGARGAGHPAYRAIGDLCLRPARPDDLLHRAAGQPPPSPTT